MAIVDPILDIASLWSNLKQNPINLIQLLVIFLMIDKITQEVL